jgi:hypothetical protein
MNSCEVGTRTLEPTGTATGLANLGSKTATPTRNWDSRIHPSVSFLRCLDRRASALVASSTA